MTTRQRWRVAGITFGLLAFLIGCVAALYGFGRALPIDAARTQQGTTDASLFGLLAGADISILLLGVFLWIGAEARVRGRRIETMYWPMFAAKLSFALYMMLGEPQYLDFLAHGLRPTWMVLYTPVVRIAQAVLLLAFVASFGAIAGVILRGRDWTWPRLIALYLAILAVAVTKIVIVLWIV